MFSHFALKPLLSTTSAESSVLAEPVNIITSKSLLTVFAKESLIKDSASFPSEWMGLERSCHESSRLPCIVAGLSPPMSLHKLLLMLSIAVADVPLSMLMAQAFLSVMSWEYFCCTQHLLFFFPLSNTLLRFPADFYSCTLYLWGGDFTQLPTLDVFTSIYLFPLRLVLRSHISGVTEKRLC